MELNLAEGIDNHGGTKPLTLASTRWVTLSTLQVSIWARYRKGKAPWLALLFVAHVYYWPLSRRGDSSFSRQGRFGGP
ncbi:hypothetical protein [Polyangium mundeleinium]|uniref:Uncharacterized protein n=1 Tax=Polyangium mundeleinium TaxID=2995306 RepID=A0ABT5F843_9BACT|nr:hypothetical protein [Polyangium mundeleinium]MDC0749322.1 hypothetical protein [Polyangium mundeleinium]